MRNKHSRSGFTLIEMLVVIAIIALLASILIPTVNSALKKGKEVKSMSRLRQFSQAGMLYAQDHEAKLPHVRAPGTQEGWYMTLWPYLDQEGLTIGERFSRVQFREEFLRCPAYPLPLSEQDWNHFGFGMNGLPLAGDRDHWFYDHTQPTIHIYQITHPSRRPWFGSANAVTITFNVQGTQFYVGGPYNNKDSNDPENIRFGNHGLYSFYDGSVKKLTPEEALKAFAQTD